MNSIRHANGFFLKDWVPTEVHDWKGKETNCLVLNYTLACSLACDFCCYGCGPHRKEKMPLALGLSLVEQAAELGKFSSVGFTGGEVMLCYDELLIIGNSLRRLGLPFTIATACHWAGDSNAADSMVSRLAERGLVRLNISHDPSHARFVPADAVINAAKASNRHHIETYVVGTFYSAEQTMSQYVPELVDLEHVRLVDKYVAKVGRASNKPITQETYGLKLELDDLCCYRRIFHDLVVFFDGSTYPCCSTFNRATPGISIGNAFRDSLRTLWERVEGSLMYRVMKRKGFQRVYDIVEEIDPALFATLPRPEDYVGPCSLCNALFRTGPLSDRIKNVFSEYERRQVALAVDRMVEMFGEHHTARMLDSILAES